VGGSDVDGGHGDAAGAGLARPFTLPADVGAGIAGVVALVVAALAAPADPPRPRPAGVRWWALLAGVALALELIELFGAPRAAHPTLSSLAGPVLAHWPGRTAAYLAWLSLGRALARR
jgi:hypothetical protein